MAKTQQHLNGNMLCAVDVETTGLEPGFHDIWQVCILPLDSAIKPSKEYLPFYMDMALKQPENIDRKAVKTNREEFARKQQRAIDPWTCAEQFDSWFERLDLPVYKKIVPLAQNWPFDREFLIEWLGHESFHQFFSPLYRDSMGLAIGLTDVAAFKVEKIEIPHYNLTYLCKKMGITNQKPHDALQDCIATAEVYRRLLAWAR